MLHLGNENKTKSGKYTKSLSNNECLINVNEDKNQYTLKVTKFVKDIQVKDLQDSMDHDRRYNRG